MSSQQITLLLYPLVSNCGGLVLAPFKHIYKFLINYNDVIVSNLIRRIRELNSPKDLDLNYTENYNLTICRIGKML